MHLGSTIVEKAIHLNELFQSYSITESARCTYVSAVLVALTDDSFRAAYGLKPSSKALAESILVSIKSVFADTDTAKLEALLAEYAKILNEPIITQEKIKHRNRKSLELTVDVNKEVVKYLNDYIFPLTQMDRGGFDVLGRFYTEFIRYAGSAQAQGLVLTPFHITGLFVELANITKNSVVYDPCCGTAGFLISAMKRMVELAGNDQEEIRKIKSDRLIGVELRPSMFMYACSNMMLRGGGRSSIYRGDCFVLGDQLTAHRPTVAFLNPPYDVGTSGQMRFVEHAVDVVSDQDGVVVAIVQMSAFTKNQKDLRAIKSSILAKARLVAVISMPDDLFYPVGVVTAVIVLRTGTSNGDGKTWFGYLKDDGFQKVKHRGRVDSDGEWEGKRKALLDAYNAKQEVPGMSVLKAVGAEDEWCAEAYLHTDYGVLRRERFEEKLRSYLAFLVSNDLCKREDAPLGKSLLDEAEQELSPGHWQEFRYDEVFEIRKGYYNKKPDAGASGQGIYFVGASDSNNGVTSWHSRKTIESTNRNGAADSTMEGKTFPGNGITVSNNGSVGCAFYQPTEFTCTHDVNPLYLKHGDLSPHAAIFICVLIELEKYRWAYGRKWRPARMPRSRISLPIVEVDGSVVPDVQYMEDYVKSLAFSANIELA